MLRLLVCLWWLTTAGAIAQRTYLHRVPSDPPPPECVFLSSVSAQPDQLNRSYVDSVCAASRPECTGGRALMSFTGGDDVVTQFTCEAGNPHLYTCGDFMPFGPSTARTFVEPLYRTLVSARMNGTRFWTLTNDQGRYTPYAYADTRTNLMLFDYHIALTHTETLPWLCVCQYPNATTPDAFVFVMGTDEKFGPVGVTNVTVHYVVPGWYTLSRNVQPPINVRRYQTGDTVNVNGSYAIERINIESPQTEWVFARLTESAAGFAIANMTGGEFAWSAPRLTLPRPGLWVVRVLLDTAPTAVNVTGCAASISDRLTECWARYTLGFVNVSIAGYTPRDGGTGSISARFIIA